MRPSHHLRKSQLVEAQLITSTLMRMRPLSSKGRPLNLSGTSILTSSSETLAVVKKPKRRKLPEILLSWRSAPGTTSRAPLAQRELQSPPPMLLASLSPRVRASP